MKNLKKMIFFYFMYMIGVSGKGVKIIGGEDANIQDFPHAVSIRYHRANKHFCGGAIISSWHIITAAHCMYNKTELYYDIKLYVGSSSSRTHFERPLGIGYVFFHPQYRADPVQTNAMEHHDIAIIMVDYPIEYNIFKNKVVLPSSPLIKGFIATLAGWGSTSYPSNIASEHLQYINMTILDNKYCEQFLPCTVQDEQFCAYNSDITGACVGDSGAPLTISGELIGIVSFSRGCAEGFPDVYTKIYAYLEFINAVTKPTIIK